MKEGQIKELYKHKIYVNSNKDILIIIDLHADHTFGVYVKIINKIKDTSIMHYRRFDINCNINMGYEIKFITQFISNVLREYLRNPIIRYIYIKRFNKLFEEVLLNNKELYLASIVKNPYRILT